MSNQQIIDHRDWLYSHDLTDDQFTAAENFYYDWEINGVVPELEDYINVDELV